jgi:pyruvate,orthophosphate dikinase
VDGLTVREGEEISIDGSTGEVFLGAIPTVTPSFDQQRELARLLGWADEVRRLGVWANADYPRDAARAREFGAEGIGLCRTEHMFFEPERLPIVRHMILNADEATRIDERLARLRVQAAGPDRAAAEAARRELAEAERTRQGSAAWRAYHGALERLLEFQREDFKGIFRAMTGLPVVIRLLDPPLHEFLPRYEDLLLQVERARADGADPAALAEPERLLAAVESMREANPMLGLRGCRLGLTHPAINEMQVRAILCAAADVQAEGYDPRPEIMIPLVGHANELRLVREQLEAVARQVEAERGVRIPYRFGTMIEIPRAALTADEIAQHAEFFSFGTNDLTQLVFGYSRDDAEGKFLLDYVQRKILPENPFQTLDREGVGKLMRIAVELGRGARPDLKLGICGEHGGDPASVAFCHGLGLDYVSCSPFRVPVARLAAAQAALAGSPASG